MTAPSSLLAAECGLREIAHHALVGSTMDEAHRLAQAGAEAGTLVLADAQEGGRGRGGRNWTSEPNAGIWMTLIERPRDQRALDVLALRIGLALSDALEPFCDQRIALKWPNDLFAGSGKVAGILIEARWRESLPEWVAIGVGVNRRVPSSVPDAASVRENVSRDDLLRAMLPAMRRAALQVGSLSPEECAQWVLRDLAFGREVSEPRAGRAMGIDATGALLIEEPRGAIYAARSGSLVFAGEGSRTSSH